MSFKKGERARPETNINIDVTGNSKVQKRLINDYAHLRTWRGVGSLYDVSSGLAYRVAIHGYEPKLASLRKKLGLSVFTKVELVSETEVPDGIQILDYRTCISCNKPFVPNTATRYHCFTCSPAKKDRHKKRDNSVNDDQIPHSQSGD